MRDHHLNAWASLLAFAALAAPLPRLAAADDGILATANLAAWCIVPFDPAKRGPEERARMLERLGIAKLAYDWRGEHIPTFDAEIEAMQRHRIEITAWWYSGHEPAVLDALKRHGLHPQLWVCGTRPAPAGASDGERVEAEAARIRPFAADAAAIGAEVGLYNHREPWCEDQDHQIAVIERLRRDGVANVGIVFNFHHWRGVLATFPALVARMRPYLLAVNLDGMPADTRTYPEVRFVGTGASELAMVRALRDSGWQGPVGLLHERPSLDAERSLARSLIGLAWLRQELRQPGSGGPQPTEAGLLAMPDP